VTDAKQASSGRQVARAFYREKEAHIIPLPGASRFVHLWTYVAEFTRSGFHGPLAWWHNVDRSWELPAPFGGAKVTIPALYMAGDRDFVARIFAQFITKQSAMVPKLRPAIMLPGCGHWTEQERAPEVSAAMIDFLRSL
jgi:pimeloyl-ACP methyl ester carboxylesterase